ncbi:hypothetical protein D3C87_1892980 [compost metagenome]
MTRLMFRRRARFLLTGVEDRLPRFEAEGERCLMREAAHAVPGAFPGPAGGVSGSGSLPFWRSARPVVHSNPVRIFHLRMSTTPLATAERIVEHHQNTGSRSTPLGAAV